MKVLFLGDVFAKPGRQAVQRLVPRLITTHGLDLVVANAENAVNGSGVTPDAADELLACEVNLLTSGNHIWSKREIVPYLERPGSRLLRPANYPKGAPGRGHGVASTPDGRRLGVINLEGRVFMKDLDDPFQVVLVELEALRREGCTCILVDMHCDATSEKAAMGWFLDGKVSAVVGTHTHVQTADERLLPGGTAFITDVGMCGPMDSIIGMRKEIVLERFTTQRPAAFEPAKRDVWLQGVVLDLDEATGKARSIVRVQERIPD
ncbi:MAG: TIGR00282 family metallophosphoesterase [Anaeromyxobacter sp.]|nr:TIGR00282 family metallophosphoesterase [Anaeromyxobacter sp.]MBL0277251.1 TIGR00282 family metallophosphoesterase [Anaeromyxobacter sp.]